MAGESKKLAVLQDLAGLARIRLQPPSGDTAGLDDVGRGVRAEEGVGARHRAVDRPLYPARVGAVPHDSGRRDSEALSLICQECA